jgi:hypothetical protein
VATTSVIVPEMPRPSRKKEMSCVLNMLFAISLSVTNGFMYSSLQEGILGNYSMKTFFGYKKIFSWANE